MARVDHTGDRAVRTAAIAGRRILITRASEDALGWADRLAALGALPVVLPCLISVPVDDSGTREVLPTALRDATWLVVSSPRGASMLAQLAANLPARVRVAAVGPATARAAAAHLGRVDLVATSTTSAGLGRELAALIRAEASGANTFVVIASAEGGRDDAERILTESGSSVTRVNVYRTIPAPPASVKRDLGTEGIDAVLLASPSAVTGLLNCSRVPPDARIVTIGATTSAAAEAAGLRVAAEARRPNLDSMIEVIT